MKKIITISLFIFLVPLFLSGQSISNIQKLMDKYQYEKAITLLKKAVKKNDKKDEATIMLAKCYAAQNDIYNTKAWYERAVQLSSVAPETYFEYGKSLMAVGEYSKAKAAFEKYQKENPNDPKVKNKILSCDNVLNIWANEHPNFSIRAIENINTNASDFSPVIDNSSMIFVSDYDNSLDGRKYGWTGRGYLKIMQAETKELDNFLGEFNKPKLYSTSLNQSYHDGPVCFSNDNNLVFVTRSFRGKSAKIDNYKTNMLKLFYAEKTENGKWGKLKPFYLNSTEYSVGHAALSKDGKTLYFISDMPNGEGGTDIWKCQKISDGWGEVQNLGKTINTSENEMFPVIGTDGKLYFSSEGHPGYGSLDLFRSEQNGSDWSTPENLLSPINSPADDFATAFIPNSKYGFFSSNRIGGEGNDDIYGYEMLEKPVEPQEPVEVEKLHYITGVVKDKTTNEPLENATVFVYNPNTGKVKILKTNSQGVYKTTLERPANLVVKAMKPTYIADCTPFDIIKFNESGTEEAPRALLLDKLDLERVFRIDNIYYDFDKYNIRDDAKPELDKLVKILKENPINVELSSHTDSRGTFKYNETLSQNRANSAVEYIISKGIASNRITAAGYGERVLVNNCKDGVKCSEEDHQLNRRTEFKTTEYSSPQQQIGQFNPDVFNNNEELEVRFLPSDFFNKCE